MTKTPHYAGITSRETPMQARARFDALQARVEAAKAKPVSQLQQDELWHLMGRWEGTAYAVFAAVQHEREALGTVQRERDSLARVQRRGGQAG